MLKTISVIGLISFFAFMSKFYTQDTIVFGVKGQNNIDQERIITEFTDEWDALLKKYVDSSGNVNYAALKTNPEQLNTILKTLGSLKVKILSGKLKLNTHINLYNFLTIFGIVHFYPIDSIRDKVTVGGFNFWKDMYFQFYDLKLSLDEIEHNILRKMNEPRIHFAIVCASASCPLLRNEAFRVNKINEQLGNQTNLFLSDPFNITWDHKSKNVRLSAIFSWFKTDFGNTDEEVLSFIWPYLQSDLKNEIGNISDYSIGPKLHYDWSLNEQSN